MKKYAVIIDVYSHDKYHEVINQAYLMMISELYKKVDYIADKSACDNLKKLLSDCHFDSSNICFQEIKKNKIHCKNKGVEYLIQILIISFMNYFYYIKAKSNYDVFYNNNLFGGIFLIQWFSFGKKNNIYDMCHNEMEWIDPKTVTSRATKLISKGFIFAFNKCTLSKRFHFILLSPVMVDYFRTFISKKNHSRVFFIDHSYIRSKNKITKLPIAGNFIKVGLPGAVNPQRGLETLKKILLNLKSYNIKIYGISTVSEPIYDAHFEALNTNNSLMSFEKYNAYIQSMDVLLLLYDKESYKLTASGAILESIWNEKPIIAFRNTYFNYLFDKFGALGVLCDNIEQLIDAIQNFQSNTHNDQYLNNIKKAKQILLPKKVKEQLNYILSID